MRNPVKTKEKQTTKQNKKTNRNIQDKTRNCVSKDKKRRELIVLIVLNCMLVHLFNKILCECPMGTTDFWV